MAYLPRPMWQPLLGQVYGVGAYPVKPLTEAQIEKVCRQVVKSSISISDASPTLPGFGGLSAPVFGQDNKLIAAITVVMPSGNVQKAPQDKAAAELIRVAGTLSRQLGASGVLGTSTASPL